MAGAKVKFGMITGDASRIKNDILSATKNFIAAKNMLMSNVDSNSKQLSYTISQTSKYEHRIRKTQTSLKVETNRLKYAKARYLKYQKIEKEARETYNLEKRRYGKAYSNYLNHKRKYEKSKRNCRNWGWLSFGVTCIIHLVKKGDFNKAVHQFNASKGRLSSATRLFRVQKARYIKSSRNVYYTKRTLSSNLRSLRSYQSRRKSLQTKQQQLTSLSVDLKTSTLKLESIVASVNRNIVFIKIKIIIQILFYLHFFFIKPVLSFFFHIFLYILPELPNKNIQIVSYYLNYFFFIHIKFIFFSCWICFEIPVVSMNLINF